MPKLIKTKWQGWDVFRRKFSLSLDRRPKLRKLYAEAEKATILLVAKENENIYFGQRYAALSEKSLQHIANRLMKSLPPQAYKIALRYLENTLQLGSQANQLCWDVPHTLKQFSFQKVASLFWADHFSLGRDEHQWQELFIKNLDTICNPNQEAGRLLWAAIIFGGYTESPRDFFMAIEKSLHFDHHGLYLDIGSNIDSMLPPRFRWHADPLSEILISDFIQKELQFLRELNTQKSNEKKGSKRNVRVVARNSKAKLAFNAFRDILMQETCGVKRVSYKQAILLNQHSRNIFLPPFLSHPDGSPSLVTPLIGDKWNRIKDKRQIKIQVIPQTKKTTFVPTQGNQYSGYLQEKKWFDQGTRLFNRKKINRLTKDSIATTLETLVVAQKIDVGQSIALMLLTWGTQLIQHGSRRVGRPVKVQVAYDYLRSIGPKLICVLGSLQGIPQSTDEWTEVYADALDQIHVKNISKISSRIYDFHRHLVHNGWADPINEKDIRRYGPKGKSVDANLVTFNEMDMLFSSLDEAPPGRLLSMQRLIFALGFHCGMRVTEILSLRIADIRVGIQTMASITLNAYQDTKSSTSKRDVPLTVFLPPILLDDLLTFREFRLGEAHAINPDEPDHNELLFAKRGYSKKPLPYDSAIRPVIKILHEITGDQTLRFHHLRHSFANWTLVRLLAPHYPMVINTKIDAFNHPAFESTQTNQLSENLMYAGFKVRPVLYQVANLLGHATPKTTLSSYIHVSDWLTKEILHPYLEPRCLPFQLQNIMNISQSGLYKRRSELNISKHKSGHLSSYLHYVRPKNNLQIKTLEKPVHDPLRKLLFLDRIVEGFLPLDLCILQEQVNTSGILTIAKVYRVDPDWLKEWLAMGSIIVNYKHRKDRFVRPTYIHIPLGPDDTKNAEIAFLASNKSGIRVAKQIDRGLEHFWTYGQRKNFNIKCSSIKELRQTSSFLLKLGAQKMNFVIRYVMPRNKTKNHEATIRQYWATSIDIPVAHVVPYRKVHFDGRYSNRKLGFCYLSIVDWGRLIPSPRNGLPSPRGVGEGIHFAIEVQLRLRLLLKSSQDCE